MSVAFTGAHQEDLQRLGKLANLQRLSLEGLVIDSATLEAFSGLRLRSLRLPERSVFGERHLDVVATFPLTRLSLASYRKLPASAFKGLVALSPTLRQLDVSNTRIDDDALCVLAASLSKLYELEAARTSITNTGVEALVKLEALITLDISRTAVNNAGVAALAQCSLLHSLNLMYTRTSTRGVLALSPCRSLQRLNLRGTYVSAERVREGLLRKSVTMASDLILFARLSFFTELRHSHA